MKCFALLVLLAVPAAALVAFWTGGPPEPDTVLIIDSADGEPVSIAGTALGPFSPGLSPLTRVAGTTPYDVEVPPGDFAAAIWQQGEGSGLTVTTVSGLDTTWSRSEPAPEHVLIDRRDGLHIAGSALER